MREDPEGSERSSVREDRDGNAAFLVSELGRYAVHVVEYEIVNKYGLTNPPAERIVLALRGCRSTASAMRRPLGYLERADPPALSPSTGGSDF